MAGKIVVRENNRHGSAREPVASTISTPDKTAPLESRRQRRALRGPKNFRTAVVSTVRDADADPVQILRPAGKRRRKPRQHRDEPGRFTRDLGGSTPCDYVYGTG